jgi:hypothetical protein
MRRSPVHRTDGNHQSVGRQQRASQKPYRNVDTDNPLSGADDAAWTRPHSFAVPLQLFADNDLL